jgi:hypothetical protein
MWCMTIPWVQRADIGRIILGQDRRSTRSRIVSAAVYVLEFRLGDGTKRAQEMTPAVIEALCADEVHLGSRAIDSSQVVQLGD